jgi:hypothetical protein
VIGKIRGQIKMLDKEDLDKIADIEEMSKDGLHIEHEEIEFLCRRLRDVNDEIVRCYKDVY